MTYTSTIVSSPGLAWIKKVPMREWSLSLTMPLQLCPQSASEIIILGVTMKDRFALLFCLLVLQSFHTSWVTSLRSSFPSRIWTLILTMVKTCLSGSVSLKDSTQVGLSPTISSSKSRSTSITDGLMTETRLWAPTKITNFLSNSLQRSNVRFIVTSFSKASLKTSVSSLISQKRPRVKVKRLELIIAFTLGMMSSIKISWSIFWSHLNQESSDKERLYT